MFTVKIDIGPADARLKRMPDAVRAALKAKVTPLADALLAKARGAAPHKSGTLAASIKRSVRASSKRVTGRIYIAGKAKAYGAAQERGAKTAAHEIVAKGSVLAFAVGGKTAFAQSVHHPGAVIPAKHFLRQALAGMKSEIRSGLLEAVQKGLGTA